MSANEKKKPATKAPSNKTQAQIEKNSYINQIISNPKSTISTAELKTKIELVKAVVSDWPDEDIARVLEESNFDPQQATSNILDGFAKVPEQWQSVTSKRTKQEQTKTKPQTKPKKEQKEKSGGGEGGRRQGDKGAAGHKDRDNRPPRQKNQRKHENGTPNGTPAPSTTAPSEPSELPSTKTPAEVTETKSVNNATTSSSAEQIFPSRQQVTSSKPVISGISYASKLQAAPQPQPQPQPPSQPQSQQQQQQQQTQHQQPIRQVESTQPVPYVPQQQQAQAQTQSQTQGTASSNQQAQQTQYTSPAPSPSATRQQGYHPSMNNMIWKPKEKESSSQPLTSTPSTQTQQQVQTQSQIPIQSQVQSQPQPSQKMLAQEQPSQPSYSQSQPSSSPSASSPLAPVTSHPSVSTSSSVASVSSTPVTSVSVTIPSQPSQSQPQPQSQVSVQLQPQPPQQTQAFLATGRPQPTQPVPVNWTSTHMPVIMPPSSLATMGFQTEVTFGSFDAPSKTTTSKPVVMPHGVVPVQHQLAVHPQSVPSHYNEMAMNEQQPQYEYSGHADGSSEAASMGVVGGQPHHAALPPPTYPFLPHNYVYAPHPYFDADASGLRPTMPMYEQSYQSNVYGSQREPSPVDNAKYSQQRENRTGASSQQPAPNQDYGKFAQQDGNSVNQSAQATGAPTGTQHPYNFTPTPQLYYPYQYNYQLPHQYNYPKYFRGYPNYTTGANSTGYPTQSAATTNMNATGYSEELNQQSTMFPVGSPFFTVPEMSTSVMGNLPMITQVIKQQSSGVGPTSGKTSGFSAPQTSNSSGNQSDLQNIPYKPQQSDFKAFSQQSNQSASTREANSYYNVSSSSMNQQQQQQQQYGQSQGSSYPYHVAQQQQSSYRM